MDLIAGTDEVGRGCLAGPVVAAAVILKKRIDNLRDSKALSPKIRGELAKKILDNSYYGYGLVSNQKIDEINILNASLLAMKRAILNLSIKPSKVLVDGLYLPDIKFDKEAIIGGDSLVEEISAASIIAKVYRDNLMLNLDKKYPHYGLAKHKGYPTKLHKEMLSKYGASKIHRRSFKGVER